MDKAVAAANTTPLIALDQNLDLDMIAISEASMCTDQAIVARRYAST